MGGVVSVGWGNEVRRKVVAAIVYVLGVVAVLFAVYLYGEEPNAASERLIFMWGIGVVLVVAAAMLWPQEGPSEPDERRNDADKEGVA